MIWCGSGLDQYVRPSMSLDDQSQKRKERLALLKSSKRKRDDNLPDELVREKEEVEAVMKYRNYDPETNAPKLGFLNDPTPADQPTVETRGSELVAQTRSEDLTRAVDAAPLDIATIQSRKPNWDLKRDLERKLEKVRGRQEAVVAKIVRARILASKADGAASLGSGNGREPDLALQVEQKERAQAQAMHRDLEIV